MSIGAQRDVEDISSERISPCARSQGHNVSHNLEVLIHLGVELLNLEMGQGSIVYHCSSRLV